MRNYFVPFSFLPLFFCLLSFSSISFRSKRRVRFDVNDQGKSPGARVMNRPCRVAKTRNRSETRQDEQHVWIINGRNDHTYYVATSLRSPSVCILESGSCRSCIVCFLAISRESFGTREYLLGRLTNWRKHLCLTATGQSAK